RCSAGTGPNGTLLFRWFVTRTSLGTCPKSNRHTIVKLPVPMSVPLAVHASTDPGSKPDGARNGSEQSIGCNEGIGSSGRKLETIFDLLENRSRYWEDSASWGRLIPSPSVEGPNMDKAGELRALL